ncbi:nuclear transport factor 2 family protein [Hymenobacter negativus]|uniref:Nuclear transport factor 2 family protein n=1 Tax=Hymenobacter negativus TaxID=2795026 RepID=A0ABS3QJT7_9BACT|nr:nuclear transport factor 2 family protein [Hymenobacter negativus]MBO2011518.1 nuclear transport factor 2 family protein [Hymenobacter negativus]
MSKAFLIAAMLLAGATAQAQTAPSAPAKPAAAETPEQLVQRQVDAYNAGSAARFVATYAENAELLDFPSKPQLTGRTKLTEFYNKFFTWAPHVHCDVVSRTVLGNKIIDHERVTGLPNGKTVDAVAIYEVENGLIRRVTFIE